MEDANSLAKTIILVVSILVIMLITYLILYSSSKLIKMLGETGINVMMRIMGLIVMVIAVEFFFSGLRPIVLSILNSVN
jgi:multiple antibiotic resistance protein